MHISTIEEEFEYQMRKIIRNFKKQHPELKGLDAEKLQDKIWSNYAEEFGKAVMDACAEYSGDELFE